MGMTQVSAERLTDHFINYLFDEYKGSRHVRRVAAWLGLLVLGIEKIASARRPSNARQFIFEVGDRRIKVRYNHQAGRRGGIEFVEVGRERGSPEIRVLREITTLAEAEEFYQNPTL